MSLQRQPRQGLTHKVSHYTSKNRQSPK